MNLCCVLFCFVLEFYKIVNKEDFFCLMILIFVEVGEMLFKIIDGVILVFKYCKDYEYFLVNLFGFFLFLI